MLIILDECCRLLQVLTREMLLEHVEKLRYDRNAILTNDDTLHLDRADTRIPVMLSNVSYSDALGWICV